MDQDSITVRLAELTELYAKRDVLEIEHDELVGAAIPKAVHIVLAEIDLEYVEKKRVVAQAITALEQDVKATVIDFGASVKSDHLHAVYNRGRMRWDTKGLAGYAVAHPEVGAFHTVGEPSVSLRRR